MVKGDTARRLEADAPTRIRTRSGVAGLTLVPGGAQASESSVSTEI